MRASVALVIALVLPDLSWAAASVAAEPRFEAQTVDDHIQIGYGVAVGDVDGDGRPDLLLADKKQFAWYRNPGRARERWVRFVMAENLTEFDNVCIAARDINGDGKVEVAVGAQWSPNETSDGNRSGAIFYLIRPVDPTQPWKPVRIEPHDPTTHRMQWMRVDKKKFALAVLPLHGRGNKGGQGTPVRVQIITPPANQSDPQARWHSTFVDTEMHMTHNFDVCPYVDDLEETVVAGAEGLSLRSPGPPFPRPAAPVPFVSTPTPAGEVRVFRGRFYTIAPMHGNRVIYQMRVPDNAPGPKFKPGQTRAVDIVLDDSLREGHALGVADLMGLDRPQVVAGWRMPDAEKKVGIKMYVPQDDELKKWKSYTIDDNRMACEDLKIADLDGDGKLDIVASGRSTHNLVIYWNRTAAGK